MKSVIFVCCHKDIPIFSNEVINGIALGKFAAINKQYPFSDNMGDNISNKNPYYCELTAMYYVWKNLVDEYDNIGFFHYRRYLKFKESSFKKFLPSLSTLNNNLFGWSPQFIEESLRNYDIIVPQATLLDSLYKGRRYNVNTLQHLKTMYQEEDLQHFFKLILQANISKEALNKALDSNKIIYKNIFIMKRQYFKKYMAFMFQVLFSLEEDVKLQKYFVGQQDRLYGFLSEYMLDIFLHNELLHNPNLKIKHTKIVRLLNLTISKARINNLWQKIKARLSRQYLTYLWQKISK